MENTMVIQLTNQKAVGLLHELEELHLIKVLKENIQPAKTKLSEKYKGIISKEDGHKLNEHIKQMRSEWNSI
jgi:thioredoxin reductase